MRLGQDVVCLLAAGCFSEAAIDVCPKDIRGPGRDDARRGRGTSWPFLMPNKMEVWIQIRRHQCRPFHLPTSSPTFSGETCSFMNRFLSPYGTFFSFLFSFSVLSFQFHIYWVLQRQTKSMKIVLCQLLRWKKPDLKISN